MTNLRRTLPLLTYCSYVFRDICSSIDELLDDLEKSLAKVELNEEEMRCLKELREYSVGDEGSWVLSDDFLGLIGTIQIINQIK